MKPRALIIDCRDSFTANLVHLCESVGAETLVTRTFPTAGGVPRPTHLLLSPGPGSPRAAEDAARALATYSGNIPVLGVCLGHQLIAATGGWSVAPAPRPVHGKTSFVRTAGRGLFFGLPRTFAAARYHSLVVVEPERPTQLVVDATTDDEERVIMAIRHRVDPTFGVQFHPESFLSEQGRNLLRTFFAS